MATVDPAIDELTRLCAAAGEEIQRGLGARRALQQQAQGAAEQATGFRTEAEQLEHVVALLAALQDAWRERFEEAIGRVVSRGLTEVFGEPIELVVEIGQSADLPTARFAVRDGRGLETDVMDARGGGLVNVASFLLRVLLLLSARPALARLLILDESFVNVSAEFTGPLVALLRRIVDDGGFQVLLVTHRPELADAADVAYRFRLDEAGRTVATRVKSMEETLAEAEGAGV